MYPNLNAEMARYNVSPKELSEALSLGMETIYNKLQGRSKVSTVEAEKIRDTYFSTMTIDYLFSTTPKKGA